MAGVEFEMYSVKRDHDVVKWNGPLGEKDLHLKNPPNFGDWHRVGDGNGGFRLAFKPGKDGEDGELRLNLNGASSIAATLLHDEDDEPRKYYFATNDGSKDTDGADVLEAKTFILRQEGEAGCPIPHATEFHVLVARKKAQRVQQPSSAPVRGTLIGMSPGITLNNGDLKGGSTFVWVSGIVQLDDRVWGVNGPHDPNSGVHKAEFEFDVEHWAGTLAQVNASTAQVNPTFFGTVGTSPNDSFHFHMTDLVVEAVNKQVRARIEFNLGDASAWVEGFSFTFGARVSHV